MDKLKKSLINIYSHVTAPKPTPNEYQHILAKIRSSIPTKLDKIKFSLALASLVISIIFVTPKEDKIKDQSQQIHIYNYSKAYNPN